MHAAGEPKRRRGWRRRLGARAAGTLAIAREHVPVDDSEGRAARLDASGADAVLAFGGGSAIGLAKAVALAGANVRIVAVPTTYSGSEMTPVYGITEGGEKKTGRDERVRPALVVYDPERSPRRCRASRRVTSLWNAMAHAVEALWAQHVGSRRTRLAAEEALRLLAASLARLARAARRRRAREDALEGAYLAGVAFADAGARAAPQALSRARRHVRSAPRGDARRAPPARRALPSRRRRPRRCARSRARSACSIRWRASSGSRARPASPTASRSSACRATASSASSTR